VKGRPLRFQLALIGHLVRREFVLSYRRSTLGFLWSLLLPLAQLLVLVLVFDTIVPLGIERYPAFVFSGLLPWTWFSTCVSMACGLFIANRDLVRHPDFRPAVLMVVTAIAGMITYLAALPILLVVMVTHGQWIGPAVLFFPVLGLVEGVLIVGLGLLVATLNVFYRDIQYLTGVGLMLLFYLTPVFYRPPDATRGTLGLLYDLNPMAGLVQGYRAIFFDGTMPSLFALAIATVLSALVAVVGYAVYRRAEHDMIDVL